MAWKLKTGINTLKANPPWPPFPEQRGLDKTKGESPLAPLLPLKGVLKRGKRGFGRRHGWPGWFSVLPDGLDKGIIYKNINQGNYGSGTQNQKGKDKR